MNTDPKIVITNLHQFFKALLRSLGISLYFSFGSVHVLKDYNLSYFLIPI